MTLFPVLWDDTNKHVCFPTVDRCGMRALDGYGLYMPQRMLCKVDRCPGRFVECGPGVTT